jgi:hypothetical protein
MEKVTSKIHIINGIPSVGAIYFAGMSPRLGVLVILRLMLYDSKY